MDIWNKSKRSYVMSRIKARDTLPEVLVRKALFKKGFRYRINVKSLPGKPDIVLPKYHVIIFVNGCFWHQHGKCIDSKMPASNRDYWKHKLEANKKRDKRNIRALKKTGWTVITVWECEVTGNRKKQDLVFKRIEKTLSMNR